MITFHRGSFILALAAALVCGGNHARAGAAPAGDAALERALRADLSDYLRTRSSIEHISTLSLTVSARGRPPTSLAVGTMQYGGGAPVTPDSLFQIGSNTKSFTAAIVLRLEAAHALSIDDTVGKWLPQYPAWATPAWEADYAKDPFAQSTPAQLVAYVYPQLGTPGASWSYTNTGYILAQMIVDKASPAKSYTTELRGLIAAAGLRNTYYEPYFYPAPIVQRMVSGYDVNTDDPGLASLFGKDTRGFSLGWTQAAGGLVSTPDDLTTWVRELFEGAILAPAQQAELTRLVAIPGGQRGFGLGVFQITDPAMGTFWGYQGSTIGYRAVYAYFPSSGLIITIFTNSQAAAAVSTVDTALFHTVYRTLQAAGAVNAGG